MNPEESQDYGYLLKYWDVIAAIAWSEFQTHGRGAVLVQNTGKPDEEMVFIPLKMLAANPLGREYAALARVYEPRREAVVIFMRSGGSISAYKGAMPGRETPPKAYERLRAILFVGR